MSCIELKTITVQIPSWMNVLDQKDINELLQSSDESDDQKIIACGSCKADEQEGVFLLTLSGKVFIFLPSAHYIPVGDYIPVKNGEEVYLPNSNSSSGDRWPGKKLGFNVSSSWLLERSKSALSHLGLFVNDSYLGDIDVETIESTNT